MNCQNLCPQNKEHINNIEEGITFNHNETEMFMNNIELAKLPLETQEKLKSIEMYNYYNMFLRNLNVLLENVIIK